MNNPLDSVPPGLDLNGQPAEVAQDRLLNEPLPTTVIPASVAGVSTMPDGSRVLVVVAVAPGIMLAPNAPLPLHRYEVHLNAESARIISGALAGGVVMP